MSPRLEASGSGRRNTPDLSGAINATRRLVEAMESGSGAAEVDAARVGEGSPGTGKETLSVSTPPPLYSESDNSTAHPPVERYLRADGKIGVTVSHGYQDGGWSTRIRHLFDSRDPATPGKRRRMEEVAIFDKAVVAAVLEGDTRQARRIAVANMRPPKENRFAFDHVQLSVVWVAAGDEFEVVDSSGFERIRVKNPIDWWRA